MRRRNNIDHYVEADLYKAHDGIGWFCSTNHPQYGYVVGFGFTRRGAKRDFASEIRLRMAAERREKVLIRL